MRGEGREAAGGVPRAAGITSSVTAAPCQLPQRGNVINLRISPNENDKTEVDFTR